jgi:hypothetical protein
MDTTFIIGIIVALIAIVIVAVISTSSSPYKLEKIAGIVAVMFGILGLLFMTNYEGAEFDSDTNKQFNYSQNMQVDKMKDVLDDYPWKRSYNLDVDYKKDIYPTKRQLQLRASQYGKLEGSVVPAKVSNIYGDTYPETVLPHQTAPESLDFPSEYRPSTFEHSERILAMDKKEGFAMGMEKDLYMRDPNTDSLIFHENVVGRNDISTDMMLGSSAIEPFTNYEDNYISSISAQIARSQLLNKPAQHDQTYKWDTDTPLDRVSHRRQELNNILSSASSADNVGASISLKTARRGQESRLNTVKNNSRSWTCYFEDELRESENSVWWEVDQAKKYYKVYD